MMSSREIISFKYEDLLGLEEQFEKFAKINVRKMPKRYENLIPETRELIRNNVVISGVIQTVNIKEKADDAVILATDDTIIGNMVPNILKDSSDVIFAVVSLKGFTELAKSIPEGEMMKAFLIDAWGSALVETAQDLLYIQLKERLLKEGKKPTYMWSPGQHNFNIENQKPIFNILKPGDIGVELDSSYVMKPIKSASCMMGVVNKEIKDNLMPCSFCELKERCPSFNSSQSIPIHC